MCFKKKDELYNKEVPELLNSLECYGVGLINAEITIKAETGYCIDADCYSDKHKIKIDVDKKLLNDILKCIRHHEAKRLLRFIRENMKDLDGKHAKEIFMEEVSGDGQE